MLRGREVSPWKRVLFSYPTLIVLLLITLLLVRSVYLSWLRERATAKLLLDRRNELAQMEQRAGTVQEKVDALKTSRGIEEEVRSRYEVAKPGEKVIVIVDQDATSSTASSGSSSFWLRLRNFLGF